MKNNKIIQMCQLQESNVYDFDNHKFIVESAYNDNGLEDIGSILRRLITKYCSKEDSDEKHSKR